MSKHNRVVNLAMMVAFATMASRADVSVYSAAADNSIPGGPYNYVSEANDGTANRPNGAEMGNTVNFAGTARNLTTVDLGLYSGGGSGLFTLYLYNGSDPNTGTLLGSASSGIGGGIYPIVAFDFTPQDIVLPTTVTFIVSGPGDSGHGPLSAFSPTIGTAPDSMWFGSSPGSFVQNNTWAVADGGHNNWIAAQFNASSPGYSGSTASSAAPEPGFYGALAAGLIGLLAATGRGRRAWTSSPNPTRSN